MNRPVAIFTEGKDGILRGTTQNISAGGCSITLDDVLEIGDKILFRIDLGEGFDPAIQSAEVVWSDAEKSAMGVRFHAEGAAREPAPSREAAPEPPPLPREEPAAAAAPEPPPLPAPEPPPEPEKSAAPAPGAGDVIKMSIEKMEKPLRVVCQCAGEESILLRTSIPFLETGKKVTLGFLDREGNALSRAGVLTDVSLDKQGVDGVPFINLVVVPLDGEARAPAPAPARAPAPEAMRPAPAPPVETRREAAPPETAAPAEAAAPRPVQDPAPRAQEAAFAKEQGESVDTITPRYVLATRAAARVIMAALAWTWARLAPLSRVALARLARYAALLWDAASGLLRRRRHAPQHFSRVEPARTTSYSMRRQVPRSRALVNALRSRKVQAAVVAGLLVFFGAGVWGIVNLARSTGDEAPPPAAPAAAAGETAPAPGAPSGVQTAGASSYNLWGAAGGSLPQAMPAPPPALPGPAAAAPAAAPGAPAMATQQLSAAAIAPAVAPPVAEPAAGGDEVILPEGAAKPAAKKEAAASIGTPAKVVMKQEAVVKGKTLILKVRGDIVGKEDYKLKDSAGVVVVVHGADPYYEEGTFEFKNAPFKSLRTVKSDKGTKFIIRFEGKTAPRYDLPTLNKHTIEFKIL